MPFPNAKEKILVSKVAESFHATSSRCTFSNSGLAEGILTHDGVVRLWVSSETLARDRAEASMLFAALTVHHTTFKREKCTMAGEPLACTSSRYVETSPLRTLSPYSTVARRRQLEHDQSSGSLFVSARPIHVDATSGPSPKRVNISRSDASPGVVIIGGGAGAFYASDALRTGGYQGKITILSKEGCLPYDR